MNIRNRTVAIAACAALALSAGVASGVITGSAHDFSDETTWTGQNGEICVTCHTPHNATTGLDAPLWNHVVTTASFTVYSSDTLDTVVAAPSGASKLCLSCHDGTVAVDNFGGKTTGTALIGTINADANLGTDLSNDHPVSFLYDTTLANDDGGLFDPAIKQAVADLLFAGQVECASCHDVHNNGAGTSALLVLDNAGSALCLTCHDK